MQTTEGMETLQCRAYVTEGEMLAVAGSLSQYLHELEQQVRELADEVHVLVCERGRMPIEEKTGRILDAIAALAANPSLSAARETAGRVAELKGTINSCDAAVNRLLKERAAKSAPVALAPVA